MIQKRPQKALWDWSFLFLWLGLVYTSIFFARDIQQFVSEALGRSTFSWVACFVLGLLVLGGILWTRKHQFRLELIGFLVIGFTLSAYATWIFSLSQSAPEEAMHFIQYGMVYFLSFRALLNHSKSISVLFISLVMTAFFGTVDEVIQWFVPDRFFDWRDIGLNIFSGGMIFLLFLIPFRPRYLENSFSIKSALAVLVSLGIYLNLLFVCLFNTPTNLASLRSNISSLLPENSSMSLGHLGEMTEYGYLYSDLPEAHFKSRLDPARLAALDAEFGKELAKDIKKRSFGQYPQLLKDYHSTSKPYQHEVLVRAFRIHSAKSSGRTRVLEKELSIMNKYHPVFFKHYIKSSDFVLPDTIKSSKKTSSDYYLSEVSKHLITIFDQQKLKSFYFGTISLIISGVVLLVIKGR